ncbi:unnamed protein product [Bathycoccus prasinos]
MTPVVTAVETHPVAVAIVPETTPGPVTVVAEEGEDDLGVQFEPETNEGTAADDAAVPAMPAASVPAPVEYFSAMRGCALYGEFAGFCS